MAIYRNVQMSFWTDPDVSDDYSPKDKLFYLYVLTNTHTSLCGCYEVSIKQMAYEIGYSAKEVEELVERAQTEFKTIAYSKETKELLILKWSKYNWTTSDKFRSVLGKEIDAVKNQRFREYLTELFNGNDTVCDFDLYPIDTVSEKTDTVSGKNGYGMQQDYIYTVTDTITDSVTDTIKDIVNYLNNKCNTSYKPSTTETKRLIKQRLKEGYTEEDFYTVIDKKAKEWLGTEQEKYLRPSTLFGSKFESYLNQNIRSSPGEHNDLEEWLNA